MPSQRIGTFSHLFKALEAGCPPHAGLAIGFDRLIAVMQARDSVRDVIAFPKNSNGEDQMVASPGPINERQLRDYHLKVVGRDRQQDEETAAVGSALSPNHSDANKLKEHLGHLVNVIGGKTEGLQPNDENVPAVTAAVMVEDPSDIVKVKPDIIKSDIISLFKRDKLLSISELHGAIGESILIGLGLERATPAEVKRSATMWGLPVEKLEELVRLHQGTVAEKIEKGRRATNAEEKADRPSDPGNLSDAS
jgi:hypothetical protein